MLEKSDHLTVEAVVQYGAGNIFLFPKILTAYAQIFKVIE